VKNSDTDNLSSFLPSKSNTRNEYFDPNQVDDVEEGELT
jgi:hypothetical protein